MKNGKLTRAAFCGHSSLATNTMNNNHREFRIGVTVSVALIFLVVLIVFFGKGPSVNFGDEYAIRVRFQQTPGINRNSPVFKNGVQIGRVRRVELVDNDREVEITIMLSKRRKIYTNEQCRVRQTIVTGDASLEFVKKPTFTGPVEEIDPDVPQVGASVSDMMSGFMNIEGDLTEAIRNVSKAAGQFTDVTGKINAVMGTPEDLQARLARLEAIADETQETMGAVRQFSQGANAFFNDPVLQQNVRRIVETMPDILDSSKTLVADTNSFIAEARNLLARGGTTLDKVDGSLEKIGPSLDKAAAALESVKRVTDSIEGDVPELMAALKRSAGKLESFFDEITMLVHTIRTADGTVMKLLKERELHDKLMVTLDNMERITGEVDMMIRTDFKPIAGNVKILTDKAARDPAVFIRNLIRKPPPVKGGLPIWGDGLGSDSLGLYAGNIENFRSDISCSHDLPMGTVTEETGEENIVTPELLEPNLAPTIETEEIDLKNIPGSPPAGFGAGIRARLASMLSLPSRITSHDSMPPKMLREPIPLEGMEAANMPDQGRIVHVDSRYAVSNELAERPAMYQQMSYTVEPDDTPVLRFE